MTPKPDDLAPHLRYELTTRGAIIMPELSTSAHGALHLSESTSDVGAHVWLRASAPSSLDHPFTERHEVVLHVPLNELHALSEQINFLLAHHYKTRRKVSGEVELRKCNSPGCFRQVTKLSEHCCRNCHMSPDDNHTEVCEERLVTRGEWRIR